MCGSTNFTSADNPRPQAPSPRTVRVRNCNSDSCPHPQVRLDYTVYNRQCLRPNTVKQAFFHSLLRCPNMDKLLRTGTLALPLEVGPANNTRGFRSADGPRLQMCLFGGSCGSSASAWKSADPGLRISASAHLWSVLLQPFSEFFWYKPTPKMAAETKLKRSNRMNEAKIWLKSG